LDLAAAWGTLVVGAFAKWIIDKTKSNCEKLYDFICSVAIVDPGTKATTTAAYFWQKIIASDVKKKRRKFAFF
jgi:hypothetical protein